MSLSNQFSSPMVRFTAIFLALLIASIACSSSSSSGSDFSEEEAAKIYQMIEYNLTTAEDEHLEGYMWSLHEDSPARGTTEDAMSIAMANFDLSYEILEWEVLSIDGDTARIRVVQITRTKRPNANFRDNKLEAIHTLKISEDGNWKIYSSDMGDIEYLE